MGISVSILSNHVVEWLAELFTVQNGRLKEIFHDSRTIVTSCDPDIGTYKPKSDMYRALVRRLKLVDENVSPSEILFIDDKDRNITAAREEGINAFQFDARYDNVKSCLIPRLRKFNINLSFA